MTLLAPSICGEVICGDGHVVGGAILTAAPCADLSLMAARCVNLAGPSICGLVICGDGHPAGGNALVVAGLGTPLESAV